MKRATVVSLAVGVVLAGLLAAVLLASGHARMDAATNTVSASLFPGLGDADTNLLELERAAPGTAAPAPPLSLTNFDGQPLSLAQFRGKVVVWSLNDDRCTDVCTLLGSAIIQANEDLGAAAAHVEWLSVNANPFHTAPADVAFWTHTNALDALPNWAFATGTPAQLQRVWDDYHVQVAQDAAARTVTHSTTLDFIGPDGTVQALGNFSHGSVSTAFYGHALAQVADDLLPASERVVVGGGGVDAPATAAATIGAVAPGFRLAPLDGGPAVTDSSLRGAPLVLSFWSSTCSACTQEMPGLQAVDDDYAGGVRVVGIDVADPRSSASAFAAGLHVRYPLLEDPQGATAAAYGVAGLPVTFVVDQQGKVVARHDGALTHDQLSAVLQMDFPSVPDRAAR